MIFPAIDVQPSEERLVQHGAGGLGALLINVLGVVEQCECVVHDLPTDLGPLVSSVDGRSDVVSLRTNGVDLGAQFLLGPALLSCQVEQIALLAVECFQPLGILLAEIAGEFALGAQCLVNAVPDKREPSGCGREDVALVAEHGVLQDLDWDVWLVAESLLPTDAEEVEVLTLPVPGLGALNDEAVLAASAREQTLEVVVVGPFAGAKTAVRLEDALHPLVELL